MVKKLIWGTLIAIVPFIAACGADCESLCEDGKECEGRDSSGVDCAAGCEDAETLNSASGCDSQYDDLLDCASDDVCATDVCGSEASAYTNCVVEFCTANADDSACAVGS